MSKDLYKIKDYSDAELYEILDLNNPTDRELEAKILMMIHKYENSKAKSSKKLVKFFEDIYEHFFDDSDEELYEDFTDRKLTDEQKAAYVIADNKLALNAGWDEDKLQLELLRLQELDFDISLTGFDLKELEKITDENKYTKKVDIPVYEPTDEKPEIGELYDIAKCQELLQQINGADISAEEKIFLTAAAYRHVSFHFENIANFYAHSNKDIQELMENSALVIIDFDKAIEQGYVTLSDKISDQYTKDYPDEG